MAPKKLAGSNPAAAIILFHFQVFFFVIFIFLRHLVCIFTLDANLKVNDMAVIVLSMPIAKIIHVAEVGDMCCTLIHPLAFMSFISKLKANRSSSSSTGTST